MPLAINTNNFLHFQSTSKKQRLQITKTRRWLLHAYILDNIGFNSGKSYMRMKEIPMVKMMGIIVYPRRTINGSLGKPKNLFTLEVWKAIYEGWPKCVICHIHHKSNTITKPSGLPQQQFIPNKSMTRWNTLQVLSM
jgi:hypothetical protein